MHHTCEHCSVAYQIPDDKVAGRFLKVRCQRCLGTMHVVGLRPLDAHANDGAVWFAAIGQVPRGPYREDEILQLCGSGDIHARTRMWCAGMERWERVCESQSLAWVYNNVIVSSTTAAGDVFARAALLSDGNGWFPDPTLQSGIIVLDEAMQKNLEQMTTQVAHKKASKRAQGTSAFTAPSLMAPLLAAAVGALAGAGGLLWFIATQA